MYKCLNKFLSNSILSLNRNIFDRKNYSDTLVSISLFFYPPFSFCIPLSLSFYTRRSGRSRTADSGVPVGFRLSARAVLLRLVSGPVTNHDSSARERRGHTTLGSGSGACCHPLSPCPRRQPGRSTLPHGEPPSRAIIALRNKERRVRALGARLSEGPGCSCRCLIFATNTTLRPVASRLVASSSFCLLFLSMSSRARACCRLCFRDVLFPV